MSLDRGEKLWLVVVAAVSFVVFGAMAHNAPPDPPISQRDEFMGQPLHDPALLRRCESLIAEATQERVLYRVEYNDELTKVYLKPRWGELEFDAKEGICKALGYVSASKGGDGNLWLVDAMTNKDAGTYVMGRLSLK